MRNPAGRECSYFYGDYYRGRNKEECRLLTSANPPQAWSPALCNACPVPDIQRANACEYQELRPTIARRLLIGPKHVQVTAYCTHTNRNVADPHIGCGQCHPFPVFTVGDPSEPDSTP